MSGTNRAQKNMNGRRPREEDVREDETNDNNPPLTNRPPSHPHLPTSNPVPSPQQSSYIGNNVDSTPSDIARAGSTARTNVVTVDANVQGTNTRPVLTLEGEGFLPSHDAAKAITKLFRGYYVEPWPSWTKVPEVMRKTWFDEFMRKFSIYPFDEDLARRNFERRGASLLKNNLEKRRRIMQRPQWIGQDVWDGLCRHWQSEIFQNKSAKAKTNRGFEGERSTGPTHVGGSISMSQHRLNMTKEDGVAPSLIEVFRKTHQRKDQTWANQRAQRLVEKFNEEMNQRIQSTNGNGDPPSELDVWCDVAGLKKGRIFGLGSESRIIDPRPRYRGSSSTSPQLVQELEQMRTDRNQLEEKLTSTQNELANTRNDLAITKEKLDAVIQFLNNSDWNYPLESVPQQEDRQRNHVQSNHLDNDVEEDDDETQPPSQLPE